MTPAQIDAVTNALVELHATAAVYGPGLGLAASVGSCWWASRRINRRRHVRRGIRRLQQYANHPGSRAVLDDFHQPRKEDQQ